MLLIYFGNTFNCSYQFANYIMIPDIYKEYFSVGNEQITWTSQVLSKILNRYRRRRPKVDASISDSALSHNRRSDASEKKEKKIACPLLDVFACGQVPSPRLYRLKMFFDSEILHIKCNFNSELIYFNDMYLTYFSCKCLETMITQKILTEFSTISLKFLTIHA